MSTLGSWNALSKRLLLPFEEEETSSVVWLMIEAAGLRDDEDSRVI